jgi:hypothetical protein
MANNDCTLFYKTRTIQPGAVKVTLHFKEVSNGRFVDLKLKNDGFTNYGAERINSLSVNIFEALVHVKNPQLKQSHSKFFQRAKEYQKKWKELYNLDEVPLKYLKVQIYSMYSNLLFDLEVCSAILCQNINMAEVITEWNPSCLETALSNRRQWSPTTTGNNEDSRLLMPFYNLFL